MWSWAELKKAPWFCCLYMDSRPWQRKELVSKFIIHGIQQQHKLHHCLFPRFQTIPNSQLQQQPKFIRIVSSGNALSTNSTPIKVPAAKSVLESLQSLSGIFIQVGRHSFIFLFSPLRCLSFCFALCSPSRCWWLVPATATVKTYLVASSQYPSLLRLSIPLPFIHYFYPNSILARYFTQCPSSNWPPWLPHLNITPKQLFQLGLAQSRFLRHLKSIFDLWTISVPSRSRSRRTQRVSTHPPCSLPQCRHCHPSSKPSQLPSISATSVFKRPSNWLSSLDLI